MKRRDFLVLAGGTIVIAGGMSYLLSDKNNFVRDDFKIKSSDNFLFKPNEREILSLASLAPSGHNTQPWFIKYLEPYHWIICNDKSKWLHAVDPTQRETILSIGAFIQNLKYAAGNAGYNCELEHLALSNQDENIMSVKLIKAENAVVFNIDKIINRRTIRSNYLSDLFTKEDTDVLFKDDKDFLNFIPIGSKEYQYLNEQTIVANKIQSYRDAAEKELSEWIRFSKKDAEKYGDGLTPASMEIEGIAGWVVRNFYDKQSVMKNSFRDKNIENVIKQVSQSAGWLLITSKDNAVESLLEAGMRMQRLFLKVRDRGIAVHPMTQILEEKVTSQTVNQSIGVRDNIQFILRMGYVKAYTKPVSLRRPVEWFVKI